MKKVFAILLAVVMVMGLSVTAFAEDTTYTITVNNAPDTTNVSIAGKTFNAYKIFDVSYAETDNQHDGYDAYSYTISTKTADGANNPWFNAVLLYMGGGENAVEADADGVYTGKGLTLTPVPGKPDVYLVETTSTNNVSDFDERDFADALTAWLNNQTETLTADGTGTGAEIANSDPKNEQAVISNISVPGYYLVTGEGTADDNENVVAAAALYTTDPTAEIDLKAGAPTLDKTIVEGVKTADGASANVGDTVTFQLTSVVPNTTGYDSYTYLVSDTLSSGLTLDVATDTFTVKVNDEEVTLTKADNADSMTGDTYYITENDDKTTTFKISLAMLEDGTAKYAAGDTITITYSATVNENALTTDAETNTATLEYSNDPYDNEQTATTPETKVYVYDFDIIVDKYTGDETTGTRLENAEFVLYKAEGTSESYYQGVREYTYTPEGGTSTTVYSVDGTTFYKDIARSEQVTGVTDPAAGDIVKVNWVNSIDDATHVITDEYGAAKFEGLEAGTYYLCETEAPSGYNPLTKDVEVQITATYNDDGTINTNTTSTNNGQYSITSKVENSTGTKLPSTGGIGTTIFYVVGSILVIGAVVLLITKKRMSGTQE